MPLCPAHCGACQGDGCSRNRGISWVKVVRTVVAFRTSFGTTVTSLCLVEVTASAVDPLGGLASSGGTPSRTGFCARTRRGGGCMGGTSVAVGLSTEVGASAEHYLRGVRPVGGSKGATSSVWATSVRPTGLRPFVGLLARVIPVTRGASPSVSTSTPLRPGVSPTTAAMA